MVSLPPKARDLWHQSVCARQNQNSLDLVQNVLVATFTYGSAMSESKWKGDIPRIFLVLQRVPAIFSGGGLFLGITVTSPVRWHALCCNGFASVFFQILASVECRTHVDNTAQICCRFALEDVNARLHVA